MVSLRVSHLMLQGHIQVPFAPFTRLLRELPPTPGCLLGSTVQTGKLRKNPPYKRRYLARCGDWSPSPVTPRTGSRLKGQTGAFGDGTTLQTPREVSSRGRATWEGPRWEPRLPREHPVTHAETRLESPSLGRGPARPRRPESVGPREPRHREP